MLFDLVLESLEEDVHVDLRFEMTVMTDCNVLANELVDEIGRAHV